MNKFEKIKNWIFKYWILAIIVLILSVFAFIGDALLPAYFNFKKIFIQEKDSIITNTNTSLINTDTLCISSKIEFADLLKILIPQKGNGQSWFVGSDNKSIVWLTDGQGNLSEIDSIKGEDYPFGREGYCILTYKKKDLYEVLRRQKESGKWKITLCGPNAGVYRFYIENVDYGASLEPSILYKYLPKDFKIKPLRFTKQDSIKFDYVLTDKFSLKIPNCSEVNVYEQHSCGTAGCSITLIFEL